ncbi:MAG: hypothetical protein J6M12_06645 [Clostridia bacterium]|nr:hypothetical protein [Clostridia bacterium]
MKKRSILCWQTAGFLVASLGGVLLHFLYEWTNCSPLVAPFSGVNESTFEHMKLLFWPMLLFALLQSLFRGERKDFLWVKLKGILLGICLVPLFFYLYNGAIAPSPDWLNITFFFLSAIGGYLYETKLFLSKEQPVPNRRLVLAALFLLALLFALLTFYPPALGLFKDPQTGGYGIPPRTL